MTRLNSTNGNARVRRPKPDAQRSKVIRGSITWELVIDWPFWLIMSGFFVALYITYTMTRWLG